MLRANEFIISLELKFQTLPQGSFWEVALISWDRLMAFQVCAAVRKKKWLTLLYWIVDR